jgi:hypothetical protein
MSRSSLSIPGAIPRAVAEHFAHAHRPGFALRKRPDSDVESQFRRKPELALRLALVSGVLDRCSQPRNQGPHRNLLIHWQRGGF